MNIGQQLELVLLQAGARGIEIKELTVTSQTFRQISKCEDVRYLHSAMDSLIMYFNSTDSVRIFEEREL